MSAELRSYNDKLMPDNRRRVLHTPCNREVIDENNNGDGTVSGELGNSVKDLGEGVGNAVEDVGDAVGNAAEGR